MGGGSRNPHISGWRAAVPSNIGALSVPQVSSTFNIARSHRGTSHGESDLSTQPTGGYVQSSSPSAPHVVSSHFGRRPNQSTRHSDPLISDQYEDTPYVPPRSQPSVPPHAHFSAGPHATPAYDQPGYRDTMQSQQHPYDGGQTSPSESQRSSSADFAAGRHGYFNAPPQSTVQYLPQQQLPPHPVSRHQSYQHYYPAYQGHHRVGLEHIHYANQQPVLPDSQFYRAAAQGFSLDSILAPEALEDTQGHVGDPSVHIDYTSSPHSISSSSSSMSITHHGASAPNFAVSSGPTSDPGRSIFPDAGPYLRQQLGLAAHEPINLWSLPDPPPGEKPNQPYPMLIKLAIYGSESKQLTLQEIYNELEKRFAWFREHRNERAWKNSIRHNLSLNKVFRHVPRPITEPGKGSYWQLDVSGGEGYKRPRKRRNRSSKSIPSDEEEEYDMSEVDEETEGQSPLEAQSALADPSQYSFPSLSQGAAPSANRITVDESNIDPELRGDGGHMCRESLPRSRTLAAVPSECPCHVL
ncbi:hypothetical protein ID866_10067 [Astraeus odoratus]|nr:hypothetical protein ID866_10067 [Astraeus odoratus]